MNIQMSVFRITPALAAAIAGQRVTSLVGTSVIKGDKLNLVIDDNTIGTVRLSLPRVINVAEFRAAKQHHGVGEQARLKKWPGRSSFLLYDIIEYRKNLE